MTSAETTSTHGILGATEARGFELTRHPPAPDVADYIERHWVVRWSLASGATFTQELLPHPCVNLVTEGTASAVHGIPLARSEHPLEASGIAIGTKFRPGGLTPFLATPARQLVGRSFPLPTLFGEAGAGLERDLIQAAQDPPAHIAAVEGFLRKRIPPPDRRLELLRDIVSDMLVTDREIGVAGFARRHAISDSTLQRLFRDYVGVTPKWVLKRYRVHEAAERLASGEASEVARLAADLGYFDQAHFNRDFRQQVGLSPGSYAKACAAARLAKPVRQAA